jgi:putative redox protein
MDNLYVDFQLENRKVKFSAVSRTNPGRPVELDYAPPLGDGQGFAGLELLLVSFCGCVSTAIVALLRKAGKDVAAYQGTATGIRQENPLALKKIVFTFTLQSNDTQAADMDKILGIAANISPVWLAIKNNVEVATDYTIQS